MSLSVPSPALSAGASAKAIGPWGTLAWAFAAAALWVLGQIGGAILFLIGWQGVYPDRPILLPDVGEHGPTLAFAVVFAAPLVLGTLALAIRRKGVPFSDYLGLKLPGWRAALASVVALYALLLAAGLADHWTGKEIPSFVTQTFASAQAAQMVPLLVLGFVILAPLQEELVFRGFLYRGFASGFGALAAVLITSGAWAMLHAQYEWYFVVQIFLLGLYFGVVRWLTGSTLLTVLLHMLVNGTAIAQAAAEFA